MFWGLMGYFRFWNIICGLEDEIARQAHVSLHKCQVQKCYSMIDLMKASICPSTAIIQFLFWSANAYSSPSDILYQSDSFVWFHA
jgi:hypothetical protein